MKKLKNINLITVLGPTASGKTSFAAHLAEQLDAEIISADSRQVYREMNIGTGKDYNDYNINGKKIPYHLIDIVDPGAEYNVYEYQKDFIRSFEEIQSRQKLPLMCGGTGLYIQSVLKGYRLIRVPVNHELRNDLEKKDMAELENILRSYTKPHNTTDTIQRKRLIRAIEIEEYYSRQKEDDTGMPEIRPVILGVKYQREERRRRITERLKQRLDEGMLDEVGGLIKAGVGIEKLEYYGLEYKYLAHHLSGTINYDEMFSKLNTAIHQFAKRQMTWFRKMEREGTIIFWLDGNLPVEDKIRMSMDYIYNAENSFKIPRE